ncbi:MAG TPA: rhodanese-related sulfurtransferase [Bacteroidia bacterium]|nr:rhodanese-related sulfurtransferase [Bacteroidia bacterium]
MQKHNIYDKNLLKQKLAQETFHRITLSFYRYVNIKEVEMFRDELYDAFDALNVFGRIYLAHEGINAQISVPQHNWEAFEQVVHNNALLQDVPFKIAVEDDPEKIGASGKSFYKLIVRIKNKIVADGLPNDEIDFSKVGKHIDAIELNEVIQDPDTIVIDMRNHYESEVGRFENALCPDADTFRDALPEAVKMVEDKKDHKIVLYCTGGIRCEKASAYFKHHGFEDVNQLYGGIIEYARQIKREGLPSKFIGKNFVFDERMGERITDDVISVCHQCGNPSDNHVNCANDDCHLLFIQCDECAQKMKGCCTPACMEIISMPIEEQRKQRKGKIKTDAHSVYKSRLRPDLKKLIAEGKV